MYQWTVCELCKGYNVLVLFSNLPSSNILPYLAFLI